MTPDGITGPMLADLLLLAEAYARQAGTNDCPDLRGPAGSLRTGRALERRGLVELGNRYSVNRQPRWWLTAAGFEAVSEHVPTLLVLAADDDSRRLARWELYGYQHDHHEGVPHDARGGGPCCCARCFPNGALRPDAIARLRSFSPPATSITEVTTL